MAAYLVMWRSNPGHVSSRDEDAHLLSWPPDEEGPAQPQTCAPQLPGSPSAAGLQLRRASSQSSADHPPQPAEAFEGLGPRWCGRCQGWAPGRSKHCRQCGRCVRGFDHHCFWLATCVGARNHDGFLVYLILHVTVNAAMIHQARRRLMQECTRARVLCVAPPHLAARACLTALAPPAPRRP